MTASTKKILLVVGLTLVLLWPQITVLAAGDKPFGTDCKDNSECKSNDCENSDKKDASGNALSFCDCSTDSDCEAGYGTPTNGTWECSRGAAFTYDLDYCYNAATNEARAPIGTNKNVSPTGKLVDAIFDGPATAAGLLQEVKTFKPGLEIRLPGLEFSDLGKSTDDQGYLHIPWIGEFIKAIYNFGMAIVSIVAVVMIIMQGAKIIVSGGESKVEAYKKIGQVAIGLVIAWGSYAILYTINPALVEFKALKVKYIEPVDLAQFKAESEAGADTEITTGQMVAGYPPGVSGATPGGRYQASSRAEAQKIGGNLKQNYCDVKNPSATLSDLPSFMSSRGVTVDSQFYGVLDCNKSDKARPTEQIDRVVLHCGFAQTKPGTGAAMTNRMMAMWREDSMYASPPNKPVPICSHFTIDQEGILYPTADPVYNCAHAPSQNKRSVGVDLLYNPTDETKIVWTDAQYKTLGALIEYLKNKFPKIQANDYNIMGHGECQDNRTDPQNFSFEKLLPYVSGGSFTNAKHNRLYVSNELKGTSDPLKYSDTCEYLKIGSSVVKQTK